MGGSLTNLLAIEGLIAGTPTREILQGLDLVIRPGEIHALMGPNGSGKSTLTHVLNGRSDYVVSSGSIKFAGEDLLSLPTHERARRGLFVAMQYPVEVPGVSYPRFLAEASGERGLQTDQDELKEVAQRLGLPSVTERSLNVGFSGGEKKRSETLQLAALGARLAVLDEIDSGLDVDGIRQVAGEVMRLVAQTNLAVLVITHYVRILKYIPASHTHILLDGEIVRSGGPELAEQLEQSGYDDIRRELGREVAGATASIHGEKVSRLDPFRL